MPGKLSAICISIFLWVTSYSQQILANGGFEDENICTEYQVNCSPEAWATNKDGFGTYFKDINGAFAGERYVAIEMGHTTKNYQRTFYRTRLLCGLRKDHQYLLSFYIKTPFIPVDSVGILFTNFDFLFSKTKLQRIVPDMFITAASGHFANDTSWQHVFMRYTARGDESFLTIASFARRDMKSGAAAVNSNGHFFVFIDEVSLLPADRHEQLCKDAETNRQQQYDQDERHEYMRLKIRQNNDDPPIVPLQPLPILTVDTLLLPDVLFAPGKADLKAQSENILNEFLARLTGKAIDSIVVEGHTDNTGSLAANEKLSRARAEMVKNVLKKRMPRSQSPFITRGWADQRPAGSNSTAEGRRQNRRVEIFVYTVQ